MKVDRFRELGRQYPVFCFLLLVLLLSTVLLNRRVNSARQLPLPQLHPWHTHVKPSYMLQMDHRVFLLGSELHVSCVLSDIYTL